MSGFDMDYSEAAALAGFAGLSDDTFAEWGLTVVGFMDGDGESRFETKLYGAHSATQIIGVLEVVKSQLVALQEDVDIDDYDDDE